MFAVAGVPSEIQLNSNTSPAPDWKITLSSLGCGAPPVPVNAQVNVNGVVGVTVGVCVIDFVLV